MKYKYSKEKAKKILEKYNKGGYAEKGVKVETLDEKIDLTEDGKVRARKTQEGKNLSYGELRERHGASPEALAFAKGGGVRKVGNREYSTGRNWTNDHNHVNKSEKHEVNYNRKSSFFFAEGGSLGNHGLKQGDEIIKTMSGGVQKVKTKSGDIVYVNLANGYRGVTPPLPFAKGGYTNERRHVNKAQDYEVRYAKQRLNRTGYSGKRSFDDGGEVRKMQLGEPVIYKGETWEVTQKNGVVGLTSMRQGAYGSDFPFVPISKIDARREVKDFYGNEVRIPYLVEDFEEGGFMTDPTFGDFQSGVYKYGGEVEYAIKGYKQYTEKLWKGDDYFSEKYAVNELAELELDLRKLNDGYLSPSKVVGKGYKNAKKVAQDWLNEQIKKQKSIIETRGLSNRTNQSNFRSELRFALNENIISEEKFNTLLDESNEIIDSLGETYATGGVTKNYINRNQLNTITIKKGDKKLTYKVSDVYNGAYKLEDGGNLERTAFYVSKRNVVKVQLKDGKDVKVANGYWIKKGAKPIHTSKYDDGGQLEMEYANGGEFGKVAFTITNDYYGNLELGFYDVEINEQYNSYKSFMKYSDAVEELIKYLKSEDGAYIAEKNPKSKFEIEMVYYNSKLDKYKNLEPQRKTVLSVKASMVKDFTEKRIFEGGGDTKMVDGVMYEKVKFSNGVEDYYYSSDLHKVNFYCNEHGLNPKNQKDFEKAFSELKKQNKISYKGGGKTTFKEKATAIAKNFEGKKVEPKYQKEYGKTYDKAEAKEVGNKIAGSQKAKYDSKMSGGGYLKNGYFKNEIDNDYIEEINKYYNKWNSIKDEKDSENFKKTKPPMFGTYKTTDILEQIKHFEKLDIPFQANEVSRNQFKKEVSKIIDNFMNKKSYKSGGKTKRGGAMQLAKQIRKDGESWQSALKRANEQMRNK